MTNLNAKQESIVLSTIQLINSGIDIRDITVDKIAQNANVGKATVYDYFQSKEEVIKNAIVINLKQRNKVLKDSLISKTNFKEMVYSLYEAIFDEMVSNSSLSIINFFTALDSADNIKSFMNSTENVLVEINEAIQGLMRIILMQGMKETVIDITNKSELYIEMALFSNISCVGKMAGANLIQDKKQSDEEIKKTAYELLLKALN